jgi:hypothetical protein
VPVRVPRSLKPGMHRLTLRGGGGGFSDADLIDELIAVLEGSGGGGGSSEPRNVRQVARRIRGLRDVPGIFARFDRGPSRLMRRSTAVSYDGRVRLRLRVTPRVRR